MSNELELPTLTVVIPNHNYSEWLGDAIMSVANDNYPNKNIVVVDDCSTDNSWDIIQKIGHLSKEAAAPNEANIYAGKVDNTAFFAYHSDKAGGPSKARNIGIKAMWNFSHLFGFLDADDMYLPGKIHKSIDKFIEDPEHIGAIYTDYDTINVENNLRLREYKEPFSHGRLMQECIVHSSCIVNKLALDKCGLYDESMRVAEDFHLWVRIASKFVFVHIPESLMLVRIHPQNSTNTVSKEVWQKCWQKVHEQSQ